MFPTSTPQLGTVARLNFDAGFGYVRDDAGRGTYVFVARLVTHHVIGSLKVGQAVRFDMDDQGRVVRLVPAQELSRAGRTARG